MQISPIEPIARENLIRVAEAWCAATGNRLITAGRYAHSDPRFFVDLVARHKRWINQGKPARVDEDRKGSVTFRLYDKILAWFKGNWPEGAVFPALNDFTHHSHEEQHGEKTAGPKREKAPRGKSTGGSTSAALARLRG